MNSAEQPSEQSGQQALPLAAAAARLGLTPDALRMRLRRGKVRGFKQAGQLFVYLPEHANEAVRSAGSSTEQGAAPASPGADVAAGERRPPREGPREGRGSPGRDGTDPALSVVVEFQKVELDRLLKDNRRLNERLDRLGEELRHFREMQQREQILRQQEQNLREQAQAMLDRLTRRLTLPEPRAPRDGVEFRRPADETRAEEAADPVAPARRPGESTVAGSETASGGEPRVPDPPPDQAGSRAWEAAGPPPAPARGGAPEAEDAGDLAEILEDLGRSLRALDSVPPASAEPPRAAADSGIGPADAGGRPSPSPPEISGEDRAAPPPEISGEEQAALVDMLGRMGPSAGERRSAARIMRRLFRNRNASRGQDG